MLQFQVVLDILQFDNGTIQSFREELDLETWKFTSN